MTKESETKYRIRSWSEYKKALDQRGSTILWFFGESIKNGTTPPREMEKRMP